MDLHQPALSLFAILWLADFLFSSTCRELFFEEAVRQNAILDSEPEVSSPDDLQEHEDHELSY